MEFSPLEPRKIKPKSNGSDARSQKADGSKSKFSPGAGELRSHQRVNFTQLPYDGTGTQRPNVGSSDLIKSLPQKGQPVLLASAAVAAPAQMSLWQFAKQQIVKRFPKLALKVGGLSAADGPLPLGELISIGLTAWEIKQIYDDYRNYVHQSQNQEPKKEGESEQPQENQGKIRKDTGERNPSQDRQLGKGEIERLKKGGVDIHDLKGGKNASKYDLYKDRDGNIYVKPKGGQGPGEPAGLNVNDF